jgi:lysophospholipase L1-like esterase
MHYILPSDRRRRLAARLFAVLLGAGLAIGLLEIAVRLVGLAPPVRMEYAGNVRDALIAYRRRPGSSFPSRSDGEFEVQCEHNSLGFRDTEHDAAKPPGTFRIVALGDSFTYGAGAEYDDTYLVRVERTLNRRRGDHRRVEIVKLGLPRHFPLLERLTLEHYGLRFSPDLVMVAVLPNDVIDTREGFDAVCASEEGYLISCAALWWGEAGIRAYKHSAVARMLLAWRSDRKRRSIEESGAVFRDDGPAEAAWRELEGELEKMQRVALSNGAAFVLVSIPQGPPWTSPKSPYTEARLARWSSEHGAAFVPTLPALRAAESGVPLYWKLDGHPTPAGYAVIADAIVAQLTERGLVP